MNYEITDAVDGETLDLDQYQHRIRHDLCKLLYGTELNRAGIGCYLSHYALWERMIADETPQALIMEDDAIWDDDFFDIVAKLPKVEWRWNVVQLGHPKRKTARVLCALSPTRSLVRYTRPAWTTIAYMIDLDGAQKLHKHYFEISGYIDAVWREYWQSDVAFYHVNLPPARSSGAESIIDSVQQRGKINLSTVQRFKRKLIRRYRRNRLRWYHFTHPPRTR